MRIKDLFKMLLAAWRGDSAKITGDCMPGRPARHLTTDEIVNRVLEAARENLEHLGERCEVPSYYHVGVSRQDYQSYFGDRAPLINEVCTDTLRRFTDEVSGMMAGEPMVTIMVEPALRPGACVVRAEFARWDAADERGNDTEPPPQYRQASSHAAERATEPLPEVPPAGSRPMGTQFRDLGRARAAERAIPDPAWDTPPEIRASIVTPQGLTCPLTEREVTFGVARPRYANAPDYALSENLNPNAHHVHLRFRYFNGTESVREGLPGWAVFSPEGFKRADGARMPAAFFCAEDGDGTYEPMNQMDWYPEGRALATGDVVEIDNGEKLTFRLDA